MAGQDKDSQEEIRLNTSPHRGQFSIERVIKRVEAGDKDAEAAEREIELFKTMNQHRRDQEADLEWRENNMEWDLRKTEWICNKVKQDDAYAQNLYAAMCNNDFQKNDMIPILKDQTWSCSWRYAGGIIADMQETGDYIDWYCSGIRNESLDPTDEELALMTPEQQQYQQNTKRYVPESVVTAEIRSDLKKLGWLVLDNMNDNF